ncbi:MAG: hypothetical protein LBV56_07080 [Delftia acidovorans]|jgi:hypothetical protein|nr:hypothetical protein [Delftia acidovorans]
MSKEITEALQCAASLTSLLKQLDGMAVYGSLMQAATSLQEKISQVLLVNANNAEEKIALIEKLRSLTDENENLKNWNSTAENYTLENLAYGAFAFVYKPKHSKTMPPHWACTNCFQERKLSILQAKPRQGYECHRCKLVLPPHFLKDIAPE